jgi:hypothetical protein
MDVHQPQSLLGNPSTKTQMTGRFPRICRLSALL